MGPKRFKVIPLNREDHKKIDEAAEYTRKHFPWLIKLINIFYKRLSQQ